MWRNWGIITSTFGNGFGITPRPTNSRCANFLLQCPASNQHRPFQRPKVLKIDEGMIGTNLAKEKGMEYESTGLQRLDGSNSRAPEERP